MLVQRNHIIQRSRRLQFLSELHRLNMQDVGHDKVPQDAEYDTTPRTQTERSAHDRRISSLPSRRVSTRQPGNNRKKRNSVDSRNNPSQPLPQPIESLSFHPILHPLPLIPFDQRNPTHEVPSSSKLKEEDEDVGSDDHGCRGEEELERGGDLRISD